MMDENIKKDKQVITMTSGNLQEKKSRICILKFYS